MNFKKKFYFCGSFLPSWIRIRIPNPYPDPLTRSNPDPIRIRIRNPGGRLMLETIDVDNCLQLLDTAFKYNIKSLKCPCNEFFVMYRKDVLFNKDNLAETVSNISPMALELLGIELKKDA
jgi:hypothetical protein